MIYSHTLIHLKENRFLSQLGVLSALLHVALVSFVFFSFKKHFDSLFYICFRSVIFFNGSGF